MIRIPVKPALLKAELFTVFIVTRLSALCVFCLPSQKLQQSEKKGPFMSKILICDTDEETSAAIKQTLTKNNHTPIMTTSGAEVLEILRKDQNIHLIILSTWVGDMYSHELIAELLKKEIKKIPIVGIANYINASLRDSLTDLGVKEIMMKPIKEEALNALLGRILK